MRSSGREAARTFLAAWHMSLRVSSYAARQRQESDAEADFRRAAPALADRHVEYGLGSEEFFGSECAFERCSHTIASEVMLVAQEADHSVDIAAARFHDVVIAHVRLEVNLAESIEIGAERLANRGWHPFDCPVALHEAECLLRPDPFDTWMKVGSDKQTEID